MKQVTKTRGAKGRGRAGAAFTHVSIPALFLGTLLHCMPASAMQILDAVDHAELEAEISDRAVSRIALANDRIARVIRGPDGFHVEHDAARGDIYLRPASVTRAPREPVTLFIGTAAGFTYRLALTVTSRGSAQILIRNAAAMSKPDVQGPGDERVGALVALVRAVARRETLPGYAIETLSGTFYKENLSIIEIWRGPRFIARVLEAGSDLGAEALTGRLGPGAAAIWLAGPGTGPSGGRLAVAVHDAFRTRPTEAGQ